MVLQVCIGIEDDGVPRFEFLLFVLGWKKLFAASDCCLQKSSWVNFAS
jgi:hypothetical protein